MQLCGELVGGEGPSVARCVGTLALVCSAGALCRHATSRPELGCCSGPGQAHGST